jgi:hypothetical protein
METLPRCPAGPLTHGWTGGRHTGALRRTGHIGGPVRAFEADPVVGESTRRAYLDAEAWLIKKHAE